MQAVDFDEVADLFDRAVVRHQLVGRSEVDAIKTWMTDRRTADAQVDLFGAGTTESAHFRARGRAANHRIIDDNDPAILYERADDVQLHADRAVARKLAGHDERPADETVGDDAFFERQA